MTTRVTFSLAQPVHWPPAPQGIAQVAELRRTCVRLVYRSREKPNRRGRVRQPIVNVTRLKAIQEKAAPLLPLSNVMGRGMARGKSKTFVVGW